MGINIIKFGSNSPLFELAIKNFELMEKQILKKLSKVRYHRI